MAEEFTCPPTSAFGTVFEILNAAIQYYVLNRQFDIWEDDIQRLQDLADCYEEIGDKYHTARQGVRANDQGVYDYSNDLPTYPGPCTTHILQGRLEGLMAVQEDHKRVLQSLPAWASGDRCTANFEASKRELELGIHSMARVENYEYNLEDQYMQMRVQNVARTSGGPIPALSGAFSIPAEIAIDNARQSAGAFNSSLGAFGNIVSSLSNKYGAGRQENSQFGPIERPGIQPSGDITRALERQPGRIVEVTNSPQVNIETVGNADG